MGSEMCIRDRSENTAVDRARFIAVLCCSHAHRQSVQQLEVWANAQPDGSPAKYRWRPLFNAAVWLTPTTRVPCSNAAKMRNPLKFAGVPQTNEMISAASGPSSPYYGDMWRRYCCLTSFFPIVDTCLSCEDIARQICGMVPRWRFLATFLRPVFCSEPRAARFKPASEIRTKATPCVEVW